MLPPTAGCLAARELSTGVAAASRGRLAPPDAGVAPRSGVAAGVPRGVPRSEAAGVPPRGVAAADGDA